MILTADLDPYLESMSFFILIVVALMSLSIVFFVSDSCGID